MARMAGTLPRHARARLLWRRIHLWLALAIGLPLALLGLSGTVLVLKSPLFKLDFGAQTFAVIPQDRPYTMPGAWVANAQAAYSQIDQVVGIAGPRQSPVETDAALLTVSLKDGTYGFVTVDPYSAEVKGFFSYGDGLVFKALDFHRSFLLPEAWESVGESAAAIVAALFLLSAGSGLWLWWPRNDARNGRWKRALAMQGGRQRLRSLHNLGAVYLFVPLVVIAVTGLLLARPDWFGFGRGGPGRVAPAPAEERCAIPASLDQAVAVALIARPGSRLASAGLPGSGKGGYSIRVLTGADPHGPSAAITVSRCGRIDRVRDLPAGHGPGGLVQALHRDLLLGAAGRIAAAAAGLALPFLYVTGIWMWLRRRARC